MPKVSVIVPVYGVEKYIERCARSLFEQTLDDIEYLFIDDCTPDRSIEILNKVLDEYPQRKKQVKIHRMEKNSGQAVVRTWGMINATGEYFIHCDSDDWVDLQMYKTMYEKAKKNEADIVICDYVIHDGHSVVRQIKGCHNTNIKIFIENMLLQRDSWSLCNKLFARTVCDNGILYPKGNLGEDMVLTIQMSLNSKKMEYVELPFYYYYQNTDSIMSSRSLKKDILNFEGLKNNISIVESLLSKNPSIDNKYGVNRIQINALARLFQNVDNKKAYNLLLTAFPKVWRIAFFNPYIEFSLKLKYVLALVRLFPTLRSLCK